MSGGLSSSCIFSYVNFFVMSDRTPQKRKNEIDIDDREAKKQRISTMNINDLPLDVVTQILVFVERSFTKSSK